METDTRKIQSDICLLLNGNLNFDTWMYFGSMPSEKGIGGLFFHNNFHTSGYRYT